MANNSDKILNEYSFVRTLRERTNPEFIKDRFWESNLMANQRSAVKFCKELNGIKTSNVS